MTRNEFRLLLSKWCQSDTKNEDGFAETKAIVDFLEKVLFHEYVPAQMGDHGEFGLRLAQWIGSATTESDQQALFLMLRHLFFLGRNDMDAAYLTAYSKTVMSWLISVGSISVFSATAQDELETLLESTVFTEITDSFNLTHFIQMNNIHGHNIRYTWEQHKSGWSSIDFISSVLQNGTKNNLVLFEDFVGSGSQMETAIHLACTTGVNVLLCPIVICPDGANLARKLENQYANLIYSPVLEIPEEHFLKLNPAPNEHKDFSLIRKTLINVHDKVKGTPGSWAQDHSPFGFRNTGGIFAKYDNCPDNSVSALHHQSDLGWQPLFYRSSREQI